MEENFLKVGKVSSILFYPIKSCRGISISEANCSEFGVDLDRQWAILDGEGRLVRRSSKESLAVIVPSVDGNQLKVEAPGMEPLFLSLKCDECKPKIVDVELFGLSGSAVHVGKEADEWFSKYMGKPHTLVTFNKSLCKPRSLLDHKKHGNRPFVSDKDQIAFANNSPYLLISENSLKEVNRRCMEFECTMQRFRPNIVVSGCEAFSEDTWRCIKSGTAEFRCLHMCGRCMLPNVDPETGIRHKQEPLKTLKSFRIVSKDDDPSYGSAPILGRTLGVQVCGSIKVGDDVFASMLPKLPTFDHS